VGHILHVVRGLEARDARCSCGAGEELVSLLLRNCLLPIAQRGEKAARPTESANIQCNEPPCRETILDLEYYNCDYIGLKDYISEELRLK
jgi:hypothetical protein